MANDENLRPPRSTDEARERGSKGGKASGEARRRRKQFREDLEMFLPMIDKGKDGQPIINPITGKRQTIQQSIIIQWLLKARKGDVKAIKLMLEAMGERLLKTEETHDVTVHNRFENMTDEELDKEIKRLQNIIDDV